MRRRMMDLRRIAEAKYLPLNTVEATIVTISQ
jgi:hypothetical protein